MDSFVDGSRQLVNFIKLAARFFMIDFYDCIGNELRYVMVNVFLDLRLFGVFDRLPS